MITIGLALVGLYILSWYYHIQQIQVKDFLDSLYKKRIDKSVEDDYN